MGKNIVLRAGLPEFLQRFFSAGNQADPFIQAVRIQAVFRNQVFRRFPAALAYILQVGGQGCAFDLFQDIRRRIMDPRVGCRSGRRLRDHLIGVQQRPVQIPDICSHARIPPDISRKSVPLPIIPEKGERRKVAFLIAGWEPYDTA